MEPTGAEDTLFNAPRHRPVPAPPPAAEPPPPDYLEEETIEDDDGRGFGYMFSAIFMTIGLVLGGVYLLRETIQRGYLDQYRFLFQEVSLLPSKTIRPTSSEGSFQVFLPDDGMMLTVSLQRLRRNMTAPEKDRLLLETLFAPETLKAARGVLPEGSASLGYYVMGRTAYLNLNEAFTKPAAPSPRTERLALYSIINSLLLNNPELDAVQILIEGKPVDTAWGWLDLSSPLGPDLSLIR